MSSLFYFPRSLQAAAPAPLQPELPRRREVPSRQLPARGLERGSQGRLSQGRLSRPFLQTRQPSAPQGKLFPRTIRPPHAPGAGIWPGLRASRFPKPGIRVCSCPKQGIRAPCSSQPGVRTPKPGIRAGEGLWGPGTSRAGLRPLGFLGRQRATRT